MAPLFFFPNPDTGAVPGPPQPLTAGSQIAVSGAADRLPVELHLEILETMLSYTARFNDTVGPRYGNWKVLYLPQRQRRPLISGMRSQIDQQEIAYYQQDQEARRCWYYCHGLPQDVRNYLRASPDAWRVWQHHSRSIITNAMRQVARQGNLGPPTTLFNGLEEWPINALLVKGKSKDDREPRLQWLRWLTPAGSDLLYLQRLQYNMEMERAGEAGRSVRREGIRLEHWLNRLPPNTHARILGYLIADDMESAMMVNGKVNQDPNFLHNYFKVNPLAQNMMVYTAEALQPSVDLLYRELDRLILRRRAKEPQSDTESDPLTMLYVFANATNTLNVNARVAAYALEDWKRVIVHRRGAFRCARRYGHINLGVSFSTAGFENEVLPPEIYQPPTSRPRKPESDPYTGIESLSWLFAL
ncbi:hypothetical protein FN846DRAFT_891387 [Sphaerosporella brunnea]|uniref:Uncharacterized protein n=1 Tax=Sphaerosporella brunnea TaxID=1250544 RepID=A0A5J5ETL1_9PEZI|nr:hypothetical protein FN846DRAFT_891387 [Sphaerosporella brunnea]